MESEQFRVRRCSCSLLDLKKGQASHFSMNCQFIEMGILQQKKSVSLKSTHYCLNLQSSAIYGTQNHHL